MLRNDIVRGHKSYRGRRECCKKGWMEGATNTWGRNAGSWRRIEGYKRRTGDFRFDRAVGAAACCSYYQRVISIEVRPFSTTIDTNARVLGQGVGVGESGVVVRMKRGFSLAGMMRGRFRTQRGALLGRGTMARTPQGLFLVLRQWL